MENIRIVSSGSYHFACDELKYLATSSEVVRELGEPVLISRGQEWVMAYREGDHLADGFIGYVGDKILYAYVVPEARGRGVFTKMYDALPERPWEVVASNMSYPIFVKKGFEVVKNYKSCHKLKKK